MVCPSRSPQTRGALIWRRTEPSVSHREAWQSNLKRLALSTKEPGSLQSMESQRAGYDWVTERTNNINLPQKNPSRLLFFFFFHFGCVAYGILVPWPGIKTALPAVEAWNPNHWMAREVLFFFFLNFIFFYFLTLQYCIGFAIYQHESATGSSWITSLNMI